VDYLLKPFNPVLLRARLNASLEKKRLRDEIRAHLARLETELEAARTLQLGMLPQAFPRPTADCPVELCAIMQPAREVGGDLYDFFHAEDGTLCFFVGDVSGKGMPAALFMARTKSLIRVLTELLRGTGGGRASAAEIIGRVNRELCQNNDATMFVTMFFGMLRPATGELAFCNAGHNPPYLLDGGAVLPVGAAKGPILGVKPDAVYASGRLSLGPGEAIYLYTDGVTEAAGARDELYSERRLEAVLREMHQRSCSAIIAGVADSLRDFVAGAEPSDDITMLALRRLDPANL
jgi:sigma-B regulation protein RsbU (phosphoserine phosphatase)